MLLAVAVSIAILGLALLIRSVAGTAIEARRPFLMIVGFFMVLYVFAAAFVTTQLNAVHASPLRIPELHDAVTDFFQEQTEGLFKGSSL